MVAIDGSKFKAVNNRDKNFTPHKLQARMEQVEDSIERYLEDLDRADREPAAVPAARVSHLKEKIAAVKAQIRKLREIERRSCSSGSAGLADRPGRPLDGDQRRGTGMVGYNVQTAVDAEHHLIVAHEVTNLGHDRTQLANMARQAREAIGHQETDGAGRPRLLQRRGDAGLREAGITPLVPKPLTSGSKADGRFDKRDFVYDPKSDDYRCPAGERAIWRLTTVENGLTLHRYWSSACPRCPIKSQCTPSKYRRITRWEHEQVLDDMQRRLDRTPDASRIRRQTVEHPFGTLKAWMGSTHFLTKTLPRVRTEMSLHVFAYNLKRMLQIFGTQMLVAFIKA